MVVKNRRNMNNFNRQNRKNFSALTNDLSHYYSLTDVKYYNIDDNDEVLSSSSLSSSSFSSSTSFSSSSRSYSSQSFEDDEFKLKNLPDNDKKRLHKSITLPNANEIASLVFNSCIKPKESPFTTTDITDAELEDKPAVESVALFKKSPFNKSLSDYCMSSSVNNHAACQNQQQQLQRRRRYLKAAHHVSDKIQNGNEADDEDKYDEPTLNNVTSDTKLVDQDDDAAESTIPQDTKLEKVNEEVFMSIVADRPLPAETSNAAVTEEVNAVNTEMSDPHWDGYTSLPYTSLVIDQACINEKTQPILPWDELFFELEPLDEMPLKQNVNKILLIRLRLYLQIRLFCF